GAKHLHPAGVARKIFGTVFADQRLVLGDAVLDQLGIGAWDLGVAPWARMAREDPQEARELMDRGGVVMRVDRAVEAVAEERAEVVRKAVGIDALALHQAGVAERRFLGGGAPAPPPP